MVLMDGLKGWCTDDMANQAGDEIGATPLQNYKLFVGGLDWSTTQEGLKNYFTQYGEVIDCVIMKDKVTNQSRGFGFVKFNDPNCIGTVLSNRPHTLDGRTIDPKPCTPRSMQSKSAQGGQTWEKPQGGGMPYQPRQGSSPTSGGKSKKIFVGGIPHNCGEPELRDYFRRFGVVTEVVMIYDQQKQRPRGFGFISFEDEQSVDQAVNMHYHDIMNKKVEVKRAEPRERGQAMGPGSNGSPWGGRPIPGAANGWAGGPPPSGPSGPPGWQPPGYGPPAGFAGGRGVPPPYNPYGPPPPSTPGSYNQAAPAQGFNQGGFPPPPPQYSMPSSFTAFRAPSAPPQKFVPPLVMPRHSGIAITGHLPFPGPPQMPDKALARLPDMSSFKDFGMGNYPQDPSGYGPTRPSQSYGQADQGFGGSANYGQDMGGGGQQQNFPEAGQPNPSYANYSRVQNLPFHPYRR
uniref:DAZ-associated protein 1 n=1 Tax=Eptatretus burgeri TaxID=7764 RepID=A0A8C4R0F8_EPTBU